ncbi:MAG: substrate-binding domain-containing protein [Verrucomicrobiota bacterium]
MLRITLLVGLLSAGSLHALALDGAVVITNPGVALRSLSVDELKNIYTAKTRYWDDGQAIIIVVLPDKTDAAVQQASGMTGSQFKTFWQRLAFSGRGSEPEKVDDAAALVAFVAATKGAIAIVPADATLTGVKKIEIK